VASRSQRKFSLIMKGYWGLAFSSSGRAFAQQVKDPTTTKKKKKENPLTGDVLFSCSLRTRLFSQCPHPHEAT
jgi:hypothetical protein